MPVSAKRHRDILAVCDSSLLGKKFEDKGLVLDVSKSFYSGEEVGEERLLEMLAEAKNINLVGEETIGIARKGMHCSVGKIKGVPYAMIFRV